MKIRNGFVTNSSSSSFIVSFDKGSDIRNKLEKQLKQIGYDCFLDRLYSDVVNGATSVEKCRHELADYFCWDGIKKVEKKYNVEYAYECIENIDATTGEPCFRHKDVWRGVEESEYDRLSAEAWAYSFELAHKIISPDENKEYSIVYYEDHNSSELEHEIMPYLECTVYRMSYH